MIQRTFVFFLAASLCIAFYSFSTNDVYSKKNPPQKRLKTIIIDAGHGGRDAGAKGLYSYEKNICLAIATELQKQMAIDHPEIRILMTRSSDTYPALHTRAQLANDSKGDLFVSIHVNAAPPRRVKEYIGDKKVVTYQGKGKKRKKIVKTVPQYRYYSVPNPAKGTETYIWGAHKNEDKEVAMRENASLLAEENYTENYGPLDPNSPEFVAFSLIKTKQYFKRSAILAGFVQKEFEKIGRIDRDVRQRSVGIWVLQATAMPSVLVETGYITNKSEEDYLNSSTGQKELAVSISNAIKTYINWLNQQNILPEEPGEKIAFNDTAIHHFLHTVDSYEKQQKSF